MIIDGVLRAEVRLMNTDKISDGSGTMTEGRHASEVARKLTLGEDC